MISRLFTRVKLGHVSRTRIQGGEQPQAGRICEHWPADDSNRGRMCPECGLPMLYVPGAAR